MDNEDNQFDFTTHAQQAISEYLRAQPFYRDLAGVIAGVIGGCLKKRNIVVHSVQHRAKEIESLGRKASIPSEIDPNSPKYIEPLREITDLAGIRVIAHFPATIGHIDTLIKEEFVVVERSDKGLELVQQERFGYQSVHYLVKLRPERAQLAEYERFANCFAEVQVRTILQHAWAEIEHDIQYKSTTAIPSEIRRRFMALAGILEIADREFQAIQDTDAELGKRAKSKVERGDLGGVEITPNALKLFLDKKLGPDGRISDWSYDWTARLLRKLGFHDLQQVELAIAPYNHDKLSTIATGGRQGQTTRFELMLLASLGEYFIVNHFFAEQEWFSRSRKAELEKFIQAQVKTGTFDLSKRIVTTTIPDEVQNNGNT